MLGVLSSDPYLVGRNLSALLHILLTVHSRFTYCQFFVERYDTCTWLDLILYIEPLFMYTN